MFFYTTTEHMAWTSSPKGGVNLRYVVSGKLNANRDAVNLKDVNGDVHTINIVVGENEELPATFSEAMELLGIFTPPHDEEPDTEESP